MKSLMSGLDSKEGGNEAEDATKALESLNVAKESSSEEQDNKEKESSSESTEKA
jgi:hypothetical protein